jgi:hypothetical protein
MTKKTWLVSQTNTDFGRHTLESICFRNISWHYITGSKCHRCIASHAVLTVKSYISDWFNQINHCFCIHATIGHYNCMFETVVLPIPWTRSPLSACSPNDWPFSSCVVYDLHQHFGNTAVSNIQQFNTLSWSYGSKNLVLKKLLNRKQLFKTVFQLELLATRSTQWLSPISNV